MRDVEGTRAGVSRAMLRRFGAAVVFAVMAAVVLAPPTTADTCCANRAVDFQPASADPGDTVTVDGIVCLNADNSGPLELKLVSFWLAKTNVPASSQPDTTPSDPIGPQSGDVPPVGRWHAFASVSGAGLAAAGSATIVVPGLRSGRYQLWWLCDNGGGPGSGIHYSGGPRLTVGLPDSATAGPAAPSAPPVGPPFSPVALLAGAVAGMVAWRRFARR